MKIVSTQKLSGNEVYKKQNVMLVKEFNVSDFLGKGAIREGGDADESPEGRDGHPGAEGGGL